MNKPGQQNAEFDDAGEWLPTRASLLERLQQWSDNASWQEFFDTYWKQIFRTARAAGLDRNDAEAVVQETIITVAQLMPDFRYRPSAEGGSFKEWLHFQIKWRIIDHVRRNRRHRDMLPMTEASEGEPAAKVPEDWIDSSADAQWDRDWELTRVEAGLQRLKRQVDARRYQVFYLLEMKSWKSTEVARQMGISLAAVYTSRFRMRKRFRKIMESLKDKD